MTDFELARALFPKPSDIVGEAFDGSLPPSVVEAVAVSDSEGGMVKVQFLGDTSLLDAEDGSASDPVDPDADYDEHQFAEIPCSAIVSEGDSLLVTVADGAPVDATATGWGDRVGTRVDTAETLAGEAKNIAEATGQHFWSDTSGVHVSTVAQDPEGTSNILLNSGGMLIREEANNRAALTPSGVAFYDGNGNQSANIVASFGSGGAQVGALGETHLEVDSNSVDVVDANGSELFTMGTDGSTAMLRSSLKYASIGMDSSYTDYSQLYIVKDTNYSQITSNVHRSNGNYVNSAEQQVYVEDGAEAYSSISAQYTTVSGTSHDALVRARATGVAGYVNADADKVTVNSQAIFVTETKDVTIGSTAVGTNATGSVSIAKTGYTVLATEWWWASGTRQNFMNDYGSHHEGNTFYYRFCNVGSAAANGTLRIGVSYARSEMF